jgi:hypothetical protein
MRTRTIRILLFALAASSIAPALLSAQAGGQNESFAANFHDDLVQEGVNLGDCKHGNLAGISGCAETLFTGTPFHIAVGSLAPQNGVGFGLAAAEAYYPTYCASWIDFTKPPAVGTRNACHWSLNFNAEGLATSNQSWRAGFYMSAVHLSTRQPQMHIPGQPGSKHPVRNFTGPSTTVNFYSESNSLNRIYFYGLGPNTTPAGRADFGLTENVTGASLIFPIRAWWIDPAAITLLGEVNGRFPSQRGSYGDTSPSIEQIYNNTSAPGLSANSNYFQAGEGIRLSPVIPLKKLNLERLELNYLTQFQQYVAGGASYESFRRFNTDLNHTLVLYTRNVGKPAASRPPVPGAPIVPPISPTRDVTGSLTARLFIQESIANQGHIVPFYLQPTMGGSDLNGQANLSSYPDYRFRGPNLLLIHGAYEQSLGKFPAGLFLSVDEAKVGLRRDDISFDHLRHSYSAGFTLHAGGLPAVYVLFCWGGNEGSHTIANINTSLLGNSVRPSLF